MNTPNPATPANLASEASSPTPVSAANPGLVASLLAPGNQSALLAGRHAMVTGGSKGIGLAIAAELLQQGAKVTLSARSSASLQAAQQQLLDAMPGEQGRIYCLSMDVSDASSVAAGFASARVHFGSIDILINNAGQAGSAPFGKTGIDLWQQMLAVNLTGTYLCTQQALPDMLEAGWGRIINIASTAALTGYAYVSAYCAAKHGVLGLTRSLALEVATKGVTVNAVCPGYTETDIVAEAVQNIMAKTGRSAEQARAKLAAGNPQQRLVQPQEVAHTVAWLCQNGSSAINGQAIAVAGGEIM